MKRFMAATTLTIAAAMAGSAAPAGGHRIAPRLTMGETRQAPAGPSGCARGPALAFGAGKYLLVFQDGYNGLGGESDIKGVFLDRAGGQVGKAVVVCRAGGAQESAAVAACGDRFLVAWADFRNGRDYDLYGAVVGADGKVGREFVIAGGEGEPGGQTAPAVASNGKDAFFAVWQDHRGGKQFEVFGARISAAGVRPDAGGSLVMGSGARPRVAYLDGRYYVTIGATGCVVEPDGRAGKPGALWTGAGSGGYSITAAYGKALEILNVSPSPDPWGWGGNGTILGLTVGADGSSPETKVAEHRWGGAAANQADRVTKNVLVAARWRNCAGWPQGRPGGFKGSHDGTWPSGQTAAAFNGRSLLAAWTTGNFIDILRLGNRDIYLKRVVDGWHGIDEPPLKVVAGPTDEVSPVLASDGAGGAILAWERQDPRGGVAVEFAPIAEEADGAPPAVAYIQKMSDTKLIVGFDEPIAAGTVKPGAVAVGAAKVVSVAYNEEGPSLGREIVVETEPLAAGKAYPLAVTGIADTFGNAVSGATVEYVARPGAAQRTPFISRWLTIGKWPADYEADFVRAADCRPSPGDVVKGLTDAELTAHMKKFVSAEKYEQLTKRPLDEAVPRDFGGDKKWIESRCRWAASVLDFIDAGHGKRNLALAFAHTYVWSDRERDVMVRLDSNSGHRAWLNGRVISDEPMGPKLLSRGMHDRTNEIAAKLDKGWNRLLVGVDAYLFSWSLSAQITDMNREPIRDLTYQLEAPKE